MNWFVARIVFHIIVGDGEHTPQFDEVVKLFAADNETSAFEKALLAGESGQDSFLNSSGEKVEWKFIGVSELNKINQPEDSTELYSKIIETNNADRYVYFIQQKNDAIEARLIPLKSTTIA